MILAGSGFVQWAWREACVRTCWTGSHDRLVAPDMKRGWSPDYEYKVMLERAARGEKP